MPPAEVPVPKPRRPRSNCCREARRRAVAEVARRHGLWVVEDDVYGALLDRSPLVALLPERGIVVTSLSKTVAAGLRFGLIAGAWPLAPLMAEVACRWIEDGTATRRLAWQRAEVAARHTLARHTLVGTGARAGPPGPHLWLPLAFGADEVAACCRAAGVEVVASPLFAVTREAPKACESASPRPAAAPNWPVRLTGVGRDG